MLWNSHYLLNIKFVTVKISAVRIIKFPSSFIIFMHVKIGKPMYSYRGSKHDCYCKIYTIYPQRIVSSITRRHQFIKFVKNKI